MARAGDLGPPAVEESSLPHSSPKMLWRFSSLLHVYMHRFLLPLLALPFSLKAAIEKRDERKTKASAWPCRFFFSKKIFLGKYCCAPFLAKKNHPVRTACSCAKPANFKTFFAAARAKKNLPNSFHASSPFPIKSEQFKGEAKKTRSAFFSIHSNICCVPPS